MSLILFFIFLLHNSIFHFSIHVLTSHMQHAKINYILYGNSSSLFLSDVNGYNRHACVILDSAFYGLLISLFYEKAISRNSLLFPYSRNNISIFFSSHVKIFAWIFRTLSVHKKGNSFGGACVTQTGPKIIFCNLIFREYLSSAFQRILENLQMENINPRGFRLVEILI